MTAQEIRSQYVEFFKKRGHVEVPRASLVPQNDPSTTIHRFRHAAAHTVSPR